MHIGEEQLQGIKKSPQEVRIGQLCVGAVGTGRGRTGRQLRYGCDNTYTDLSFQANSAISSSASRAPRRPPLPASDPHPISPDATCSYRARTNPTKDVPHPHQPSCNGTPKLSFSSVIPPIQPQRTHTPLHIPIPTPRPVHPKDPQPRQITHTTHTTPTRPTTRQRSPAPSTPLLSMTRISPTVSAL